MTKTMEATLKRFNEDVPVNAKDGLISCETGVQRGIATFYFKTKKQAERFYRRVTLNGDDVSFVNNYSVDVRFY
ncbi:MAG TPA: hypothetical protein VFP47_20470 [Pyrinomonadaceae bacterium]|nr:hypothetical protein [Pyrinomonadaceae bacterium]